MALLSLLLYCWSAAVLAQPLREPLPGWYERSPQGAVQVDLYFFWSARCPHCLEAQPFVQQLSLEMPWLRVHEFELTRHPANGRLYQRMAASLGQDARSVPAFLFCGRMLVGFDTPQGIGTELAGDLHACHQRLAAGRPMLPAGGAGRTPALPGGLSAEHSSLLLLTAGIAGLDAFNPCAFFVLLFLLSMLVHAGGRGRILAVGGVFVLCSGVLYFLFMAAWLNLFRLIGHLPAITIGAGLLAVAVALINIKDYFWFRRGVSLGIPDGAKPGLFARVRALLSVRSLPVMLLSALLLALFANLYELLCTLGFPMVYTRILTLRDVPAAEQYGWLALYNVVYVLPLAVIVVLFAVTLGRRKLQEQEGRALKLLSGTMMLGLGVVLLAAPGLLNQAGWALALLGAAVAVTLLVVWLERLLSRRFET